MSDLDSIAASKIKALDAVHDDLPGVIIVHDLRNMSVAYMSPRGLRILGTSMDELKAMGAEYFNYYFHPDDKGAETVFEMITNNSTHDVFTMFQQVREKGKTNEWKLYLTSLKIFLKDERGKPAFTIATAHPLEPNASVTDKVIRIIEENSFTQSKKHLFNTLSTREKEFLALLATLNSNEAIASRLHISVETAKTHRRNIKRKLRISNHTEFIDYARAFDLI